MTKPQKIGAISLCLLALTACSTSPKPNTEIVYRRLECPKPPACDDRQNQISSNADLVSELLRTRANLAVCKIRGDTLQTCIDSQP